MAANATPLRTADHTRWTQLWSEYQRFYEIDLPAEVTRSTWTRIQSGRIHGLGVRDAAREPASQLVGIVHFLLHEDTWSKTPACYLQDLYVDPAARGSGHGRTLIQAVAAAAKSAGAQNPYWLTHESNAAARRLYDSLGKNHGFIQYAYVTPDA
jgi:ribosomal protein S18 acetylase RimI-like enzyme